MPHQRIAHLFDQLDSFRHLPAYQLERRADIFFAIYLPEVVERELGIVLDPVVVPEFPIKHERSCQSDKADYLLTARDRSRAVLVELKTDVSSRREAQDAYLERAKTRGFRWVMEGLREILLATNHVQKYLHLVERLAQLEFWTVPEDLNRYAFPVPQRGLTERLRAITLTQHAPALHVVYVQPEANGEPNCIDFACFARHVARHEDPLSQRFADSLLRWRTPAGSRG